MEPRNRVLLVGPPGNGKTSYAEALAEGLPRFFSPISLGITRLLLVTLEKPVCGCDKCLRRSGPADVFFFDEFDAIAKERGDLHETGEIKRVVKAFSSGNGRAAQPRRCYNGHQPSRTVGSGSLCRFQVRIFLPKPGRKEVELWLERFRKRSKESLTLSNSYLSGRLVGLSYAELEEFGNDVLRRHILRQPCAELDEIVKNCLSQWELRAAAARPSKRIVSDGC